MWYLLSANTTFAYTHADSLRGGNGRGRAWNDVLRYDLNVTFDTTAKSIQGYNIIDFAISQTPGDSFQVDLQEPMVIDSVFQRFGKDLLQPVSFKREGNVYWIYGEQFLFHNWQVTEHRSLKIYFHGVPRKAVNPPWDGGFSWTHDAHGKPWIAVSCQGLGASVWWPCKDAQWDEPDRGMRMQFKLHEDLKDLQCISNGQGPLIVYSDGMTTHLISNRVTDSTYTIKTKREAPSSTTTWEVKNPINNYDVTFYIGDYIHWHDTLMGEKGKLDLDFYALRENEEKARKQFAVVKQMMHCFEYWLGPYPFYEDGYKLVEAPYLGMEHQGAVAYGNKYQMGYKGTDRSGTGVGMTFDYIIIHESAHEWFGNNITAKDMADNWIHEGITTYSESLFAECILDKEKGQKYAKGEWEHILNNKPMIGDYGVNDEGSGDIYDKGVAVMHMIRTMTNDDEKFRQMLRGLTKEFYHKTVTTQQVENYIAQHTGLDLTAFFNQYLRTTKVPQLEYYIKDKKLNYKFNNTVPGFTLPIAIGKEKNRIIIQPTSEWQELKWTGGYNLKVSGDFLITVK